MSETPLFGVIALFASPEALCRAVERVRERGFTRYDAYAPYPFEGMPKLPGVKRSRLPLIFLLAGLTGGGGGYFMEWYAMTQSYPINVGGRPLHSWPAFIPVTFELTILGAAIVGVVALFIILRLPRPHHPLFAVKAFERVTTDRFCLCLESADPLFAAAPARELLESLNPLAVVDVPQEDAP